jgi:hypothetical protein
MSDMAGRFAAMVFVGLLGCSGGETSLMGGRSADPSATEPDESKDEAESTTKSETNDDAGAKTPAPAADAGAAAPAGPGDAFTGAGAYVATLGPSARKGPHPFTNDNPAGRACFNCHGTNAPAFAFAGTVYANAAGTTPAAKVEVRMRDATGKALSAWTDNDGNFFFPLDPDGDLGDLANAGLRNGKGTKLMSSTVAVGDCNGCHKASAVGRLVAPK